MDQVTPDMVPPIETLPDDLDELKKLVLKYAEECDRLRELERLWQIKLFGRKSEKRALDGEGVCQLLLFDIDDDVPGNPVSKKEEEPPTKRVAGYNRRQPKRLPLPDFLPRKRIIHDVSDAQKVCGCGADKVCIGQECSEQLDLIPAILRVLLHIRLKWACVNPNCEQALRASPQPAQPAPPAPVEEQTDAGSPVEQGDVNIQSAMSPTVVIAPVPPHIIPKSMASPGLLANVMASKFVDHLPFYRQEAQFLRMGVHLGRATMCGWAFKIAEACQPLLTLLWEDLRAGPLMQIDESPLQVLAELGRPATAKSYMWAFLGGLPSGRVVVFEYSQTRSSDTPKLRLVNYRGGVQTDDYAGYDFIDGLPWLIHFGCFAHVRRKFTDVVKVVGKKRPDSRSTLAEEALDYILGLYEVEWAAAADNVTGDALVAYRQERARPILSDFHRWLLGTAPKVPPRNLLGKAISYALVLWPRLERYTDYAFASLDNNLVENAFRPYVLGRKNWLFSGTPKGAAATALFYSLVETAKLNGVEPHSYLRALFELLPEAETDDARRALLPPYIDRKLVSPYVRPPRALVLPDPIVDATGKPLPHAVSPQSLAGVP